MKVQIECRLLKYDILHRSVKTRIKCQTHHSTFAFLADESVARAMGLNALKTNVTSVHHRLSAFHRTDCWRSLREDEVKEVAMLVLFANHWLSDSDFDAGLHFDRHSPPTWQYRQCSHTSWSLGSAMDHKALRMTGPDRKSGGGAVGRRPYQP